MKELKLKQEEMLGALIAFSALVQLFALLYCATLSPKVQGAFLVAYGMGAGLTLIFSLNLRILTRKSRRLTFSRFITTSLISFSCGIGLGGIVVALLTLAGNLNSSPMDFLFVVQAPIIGAVFTLLHDFFKKPAASANQTLQA